MQDAMSAAVVVRATRHRLVGDSSGEEDDLERNEGLAEYTGRRLAHGDARTSVATRLEAVTMDTSFARSFAYLTGPAYGLAFDELLPGWRDAVLRRRSLTELSREVVSANAGCDLSVVEARYGRATIEAEEIDRAREYRESVDAWRSLLVDGATLAISARHLNVVFNPSEVVPLGDDGTVYPTATIRDTWGELAVHAGALLDPEWRTIRVTAKGLRTSETQTSGDGWTLQINPGWRVTRSGAGYALLTEGTGEHSP